MSQTLDVPTATPGATLAAAPQSRVWGGLVVAIGAAAVALALHRWVPAVGSLTWAVLLGVVFVNVGLAREPLSPGLAIASRRVLRVGVALLGLSVSLADIAGLGGELIAAVVAVVALTFATTHHLAGRMGLGAGRRIVLAAGFSICGASAIAAVERTAGADDDDVAAAVAMVTLWGTVLMIALPLAQGPLGLSDHALGVWSGLSLQEVGQVMAAAQPAGAAAVAVAAVVKLTRVVMLAPITAAIAVRRREAGVADAKRPPLVPLFVVMFLGAVLLRSIDGVPAGAAPTLTLVRDLALGAGLFALGSGVNVRRLVGGSGATMAVAALATVVVTGLGLAGALALG